MKNALVILSVLVSSISAFGAEKYVCNKYSRRTDKIQQSTVVLTPMQNGKIKEGVPMKYRLELYEGADTSPKMEAEGVVLTEDVSFAFEANDKKTSFHIYLDEMNGSSLWLNSKNSGDYICR
jgi:hypothetical protein